MLDHVISSRPNPKKKATEDMPAVLKHLTDFPQSQNLTYGHFIVGVYAGIEIHTWLAPKKENLNLIDIPLIRPLKNMKGRLWYLTDFPPYQNLK